VPPLGSGSAHRAQRASGIAGRLALHGSHSREADVRAPQSTHAAGSAACTAREQWFKNAAFRFDIQPPAPRRFEPDLFAPHPYGRSYSDD
jgi:hypothetical protein